MYISNRFPPFPNPMEKSWPIQLRLVGGMWWGMTTMMDRLMIRVDLGGFIIGLTGLRMPHADTVDDFGGKPNIFNQKKRRFWMYRARARATFGPGVMSMTRLPRFCYTFHSAHRNRLGVLMGGRWWKTAVPSTTLDGFLIYGFLWPIFLLCWGRTDSLFDLVVVIIRDLDVKRPKTMF